MNVEPDARGPSDEAILQASIAISLKRIADALEKQNEIASAVTNGLYNLGIE